MRKLDRRQFTQEASLAFLAGVSVTVSACGGGGGGGGDAGDGYGPTGGTPATTPAPAPIGAKSGQVSANHGHQAVITAAELAAGGAVRIDIASVAGHSHMVELPAQAVQEIRDGKPVQKDSSTTDAHMHTVDLQRRGP